MGVYKLTEKLGNGMEAVTYGSAEGKAVKIPTPFIPGASLISRLLHAVWRPQDPEELKRLYKNYIELLEKYDFPHIDTEIVENPEFELPDGKVINPEFGMKSDLIKNFDEKALRYSDFVKHPKKMRQFTEMILKAHEMNRDEKVCPDLIGTPATLKGFAGVISAKVRRAVDSLLGHKAEVPQSQDFVLNNLYDAAADSEKEVRLKLLDIGLLDANDNIKGGAVIDLLIDFTICSAIDLTLLAREKCVRENSEDPLCEEVVEELKNIRKEINLPTRLLFDCIFKLFREQIAEIFGEDLEEKSSCKAAA